MHGRITKITSFLPLFFFSNSETFIFCPRWAAQPPQGAWGAACTQRWAAGRPHLRVQGHPTGHPLTWGSALAAGGALKAGAAASLKGKETPLFGRG